MKSSARFSRQQSEFFVFRGRNESESKLLTGATFPDP
jgi:hypothetical protein